MERFFKLKVQFKDVDSMIKFVIIEHHLEVKILLIRLQTNTVKIIANTLNITVHEESNRIDNSKSAVKNVQACQQPTVCMISVMLNSLVHTTHFIEHIYVCQLNMLPQRNAAIAAREMQHAFFYWINCTSCKIKVGAGSHLYRLTVIQRVLWVY
jgi:hypothetical protein